MIDSRWLFTRARWGDPLLAGLGGSTAQWDAWEPAAWQVEQALAWPEPIPLGVWGEAQRAYDATFGTAARQAQQAAPPWCRWLPPPWRVLVAPCAGAMVGERLRPRVEEAGSTVILVVLAVGVILLGVAALVFGR